MLKAAFRDNDICQTQTYRGFKPFKNNVCQSMMMSVLGDIWQEPRSTMWKKCNRLSWKTKDERFTTFATLSGCHMEIARAICQMSSMCGTLQQNLCQGWWAKINRNTALLSEPNVQTSGAISPGPCIITTLWLRCRLLCCSFSTTTNMTVILHPPYSPDLVPW